MKRHPLRGTISISVLKGTDFCIKVRQYFMPIHCLGVICVGSETCLILSWYDTEVSFFYNRHTIPLNGMKPAQFLDTYSQSAHWRLCDMYLDGHRGRSRTIPSPEEE